MSESTKILVVEGKPAVARAVQEPLQREGYRVTGVVGSSQRALECIAEEPPDLVVLNTVLGDGEDGVELARTIRSRLPVAIIFVTAHTDRGTLGRVAETEPAGVVVAPFHESQLVSSVAMALKPLPGSATHGLSDSVAVVGRHASLTSREIEVVQLLLSNGRVSSIAQHLHISPHTVRNHLRSIFRKMSVHSQVQLIQELMARIDADTPVHAGS